jgi:ABC-type transporter Mla maintaining outer membrane lipid asymmetry ATPase subunit MlaF
VPLSGGMLRRAGLTQAIVNGLDLLLDEPELSRAGQSVGTPPARPAPP